MITRSVFTVDKVLAELEFSATRSSKPGGQNVNKVSTKVVLRFDLANSEVLDEETKEFLTEKWANKLTNDGLLIIQSQKHRSQLQNRKETLKKLESLIEKAFKVKKPRIKTKPSKGAVKSRLDKKKKRSEKKQWRKRID